ncbi:DUF7507 domain-containing protein, partial [Lysobacter sp. CA199]|uniref:DUF7507 domain-containing protein n=1 Tax=Lysobacter sp. CA199 TaxID=3455608 RepID=UPI003F8D31BA
TLVVAKDYTLTEIGTPNNTVEAGETINYTVTVTNTGNVTITGVTVTDVFNNGAATTLTCAPANLAPTQVATCNAYSHVVTQPEADNNTTLVNTATATGAPPGGGTVTGRDTEVVNVTAPRPELTVAKSHTLTEIGTPNNTVEAGETINYTVTVTNTGNVTITGVTVTDVF